MEIWHSENDIRLRIPLPVYIISDETMRQILLHVRHTSGPVLYVSIPQSFDLPCSRRRGCKREDDRRASGIGRNWVARRFPNGIPWRGATSEVDFECGSSSPSALHGWRWKQKGCFKKWQKCGKITAGSRRKVSFMTTMNFLWLMFHG